MTGSPARRLAGASLALLAPVALAIGGCESNVAGPALRVDPAALYSQMCARCHGADGKGDPEMKKLMPVRDFSDPAWSASARLEMLERAIMAGKNQMPGFGGALSQAKIQHLAGFIKRMGTRP